MTDDLDAKLRARLEALAAAVPAVHAASAAVPRRHVSMTWLTAGPAAVLLIVAFVFVIASRPTGDRAAPPTPIPSAPIPVVSPTLSAPTATQSAAASATSPATPTASTVPTATFSIPTMAPTPVGALVRETIADLTYLRPASWSERTYPDPVVVGGTYRLLSSVPLAVDCVRDVDLPTGSCFASGSLPVGGIVVALVTGATRDGTVVGPPWPVQDMNTVADACTALLGHEFKAVTTYVRIAGCIRGSDAEEAFRSVVSSVAVVPTTTPFMSHAIPLPNRPPDAQATHGGVKVELWVSSRTVKIGDVYEALRRVTNTSDQVVHYQECSGTGTVYHPALPPGRAWTGVAGAFKDQLLTEWRSNDRLLDISTTGYGSNSCGDMFIVSDLAPGAILDTPMSTVVSRIEANVPTLPGPSVVTAEFGFWRGNGDPGSQRPTNVVAEVPVDFSGEPLAGAPLADWVDVALSDGAFVACLEAQPRATWGRTNVKWYPDPDAPYWVFPPLAQYSRRTGPVVDISLTAASACTATIDANTRTVLGVLVH